VKPTQKAILTELLPGFLDDLPEEDQRALSAVVGTAMRLVGFDDIGRAELEFQEQDGTLHTIFVARKFIQPVDND
jgi:hypothetical protein